jgi:hypothetical protein
MVHKFAFLANHLLFLLHCFCNELSLQNDSKTQKTNQLNALAGQIQHDYGSSKSTVHTAAD